MLRSRLCDWSDAYMFVEGTISFLGTGTGIIFKIYSPFIDCISKISNT